MDINNEIAAKTQTVGEKCTKKRGKDSPVSEIPLLESQNNALKKIIEKLKKKNIK